MPFGSLGKGTAVRWVYIETSKGVYNWANLDRWVNDAATHNMPIFWSNDGVPGWAAADTSKCDRIRTSTGTVTSCPSMVRNTADWDSFVTALVTRYKGRIKVYELWNEPHRTFNGTVSQMVTLTNRMYNIIRSIDPGATIVSPSGNPSYMDQYWAAGGTRGIDVVSVHGYPFSSVGGSGPAIPETLYSQRAQPIQSIMARFGLSGKPVWDTEGSWGNKAFAATIRNPDVQAAFVARFYLLHWSNGMSRAYWYAWDNNSWGLLWTPSSRELKPAKAYRQTYNWMVGATMRESCKWTGVSAYDAVYTCTLTRPNGYLAQAVWNVARSSIYTIPPGFVRYRTLDGNTYSITGSTVTIGPKPILLETGDPRSADMRRSSPNHYAASLSGKGRSTPWRSSIAR
ncbi:MAG TPA: endo-1,4-beta-xylanase [Terriglobales bacterium]|nr:endo-1,4-beta-xylanase [Terriglobales bacterium]